MKTICSAALFGALVAANEKPGELSLLNSNLSPARKIVNLLKTMKKELEVEAENDNEVNKKMSCWCKTEGGNKELAIKQGNELIPQLEGKMEAQKLEAERLTSELGDSKEKLEASKTSLSDTQTNHDAAMEKADKEQAEMKTTIFYLDKAYRKLADRPLKVPAFLEVKEEDAMKEAVDLINQIKVQYSKKYKFLETKGNDVLSALSTSSKVEPYKFGAIHELVGEIKETFTSNLKQHKADEEKSKDEFVSLREAKRSEIASIEKGVLQKRTQRATAQESEATFTAQNTNAKKTLAANEAFLEDINKRCDESADQYAKRTAARNDEITAVAKALVILDDNADNMDATFKAADRDQLKPLEKASFLQIRSTSKITDVKKQAAISILRKTAAKVGDGKLAMLASALRSGSKIDGFEKVQEALETLNTEVSAKKQAEIDKKGSCVKRFRENDEQKDSQTYTKTTSQGTMDRNTATIEQLTKDIAKEEEDIKALNKELQEASEERDLQNTKFEATVKDQVETQETLKSALDVLKAEYQKQEEKQEESEEAALAAKRAAAALLQVQQTPEAKEPEPALPVPKAVEPPTPEAFKEMRPHQKSNTVISMLELIYRDAKELEDNARFAEKAAVKDFEAFKKDTNATVTSKEQNIVDMKMEKADSEETKNVATEEKHAAMEALDNLAQTRSALKQECDFLLENFNLRQDSYDQEMDSIRKTKAILKGASFKFDKFEFDEDFEKL
eukprot:TRINITY_DN64059_c0_g1_i1.p1 TRINITY_DN64059_c0_g1~~TRINITY_DN64059_c0_g1_i1.p1  ORF type:complete len:734 (+),score=272.16 TRINITY_DN64059_c0_g1_i1:80-2281(+)